MSAAAITAQERLYAFAFGRDYLNPNTKANLLPARAIIDRLRRFHVIDLTQAEYAALEPSEKAAKKKASGYIIGGDFGGLKKAENCQCRSILTLDLDALTPESAQQCIDRLRDTGAHSIVYSTASHTPEKPRLRAVVFLAADVAPAAYRYLVEHYAGLLPQGAVSSESYKVGQIMYLPQRCSDGEEVFDELPGEPLDAGPIIEATRRVPHIEREKKVTPAWDKPGIVGAVGRMFGGDFDRAIVELALPYKRSSVGATCGAGEDRYTFTLGESADGAIWYPGDGHLYSHHGSDPCREQSATIFDVVRMQRHNPSQDDAAVPISERASHKDCERWFLEKYPALKGALHRPASTDELEDLGPLPVGAQLESHANNTAGTQRIELLRPPSDILTRVYPPREFICGQYGAMGATTLLLGEGAVGKSKFLRSLMLHAAAGLPFLGQDTKPGRYVYLSAEDELTEVWRDAQKIVRKLHPESQAAALANFSAIDAVGKGLYFINADDGIARVDATVDRIAEAVGTARMIAVDTLSRVNGADENSNANMAVIESGCARLAHKTGAAVFVTHHVAKQAAREGISDLHAGRGGSALGDNFRGVLRLMPASAADTKSYTEISPQEVERGDILRLVHAKNSYGPKATPVWLRRLDDGLLVQFAPSKTNEADKTEMMRAQFAAWHRDRDGAPFTRSGVTRNARYLKQIWPSGVSEVDARAFFDTETSAGMFQPSNDKVKGAEAFTMRRDVAETILQDATQWGLQTAESGSLE